MNSGLRFWAQRGLEAVVSFVALTLVSFGIGVITPGDASLTLLRSDTIALSNADVEAMRDELGLNDPMIVRYWNYLTGIFQGDLGTSHVTGASVWDEIMAAAPATVNLSLAALALTAVVVVLLGWLSAKYEGSIIDKAVLGLCYLGAAMPSFWLGLLLISLFSVTWQVLPSSGWHGGKGLILPVIVLAVAIAPPFIKVFRGRFIEVQKEEFVRSARARGIAPTRIEFAHVLRGTLIPVVTMLGVSLASLLSGSVVIEVVFGLPGVGALAMDAIGHRDWPVVQGFVFFIGVVVIAIMLLVDVACRLIDPSLKVGDRR